MLTDFVLCWSEKWRNRSLNFESPEGEVQKQLIEAGAFSDTHSIIGSEKQELSMGARLLKKAGTFLSQSLIDNLAKFVGKTEKVEQLRQNFIIRQNMIKQFVNVLLLQKKIINMRIWH